jgi:ABC-type multidrug transport system ATPase subunit
MKFSGAEYLTHMGRIRGLDPEAIAKRGDELLSRLDVRPGPAEPWANLSKGNRQKVVIAQAFLGRLDSVILDEPFSGLDDHARRVLSELIDEVRGNGTSVLVSSHDEPQASDRTYRLVDGLLDERTRSTTLKRSAVTRRVELVRGEAEPSGEAVTHRDGVLTWRTSDAGKRLTLVVSAKRCDDVLRAALNLGWSIESVSPSHPA